MHPLAALALLPLAGPPADVRVEARLRAAYALDLEAPSRYSRMAPAGDLDGDESPEVFLLARAGTLLQARMADGADNIARGPGRVNVFSGRDRTILLELRGPDENDALGSRLFGTHVWGLGDLDGDGLVEIGVTTTGWGRFDVFTGSGQRLFGFECLGDDAVVAGNTLRVYGLIRRPRGH